MLTIVTEYKNAVKELSKVNLTIEEKKIELDNVKFSFKRKESDIHIKISLGEEGYIAKNAEQRAAIILRDTEADQKKMLEIEQAIGALKAGATNIGLLMDSLKLDMKVKSYEKEEIAQLRTLSMMQAETQKVQLEIQSKELEVLSNKLRADNIEKATDIEKMALERVQVELQIHQEKIELFRWVKDMEKKIEEDVGTPAHPNCSCGHGKDATLPDELKFQQNPDCRCMTTVEAIVQHKEAPSTEEREPISE